MSEKRNPLNKQDQSHREGNVNNTPPRDATKPRKEEQPGSGKAPTKEQKTQSQKSKSRPGNDTAD